MEIYVDEFNKIVQHRWLSRANLKQVKLAAYLFVCSYRGFKFTQQIVRVAKVAVGTALCCLIAQLLHHVQVCSLKTKQQQRNIFTHVENIHTV